MAFSIGEAGAQTGLSADTLRYYERIDLLPQINRNEAGQRRYSETDISRLRFIRRAQSMNFKLDEVRELLQLQESSGDVRREVRSMTEQKLAAIEARIQELKLLREEFRTLVEQCRSSEGHCPIIEHMSE